MKVRVDRLSAGCRNVRSVLNVKASQIAAMLTASMVVLSLNNAADAAHDLPDAAKTFYPKALYFDFDKPPKTNHRLGGHVTYGVSLDINVEAERNFNLDRADDEDNRQLETQLNATFSYDPNPSFRAFAEFEFSKDFLLYSPVDDERPAEFKVEQAYVTFENVVDGLAVQVGRQQFEDPREWIFDEELDAFRAVYRSESHALELAVSREELVPKDLLTPSDGDRINNYHARTYSAIGDDSSISTYALYRDDLEPSGEDLLFLGVQSAGELSSNLEYWVDAAVVTGDDDGRSITGYGIDVGATYAFEDQPWEPSITLGVASGSGDDGAGSDSAYRQSGLHDNSARFNGVTSFSYYGETLDPELSNLAILTVGAGVRPTEKSSIDLVYHHYQQHRASDEFRDVAIDADPNGDSRHIGDAFDIVLGYREFENIDIELTGGVFLPGTAFDDRDPAYFGKLELSFSF